MSNVKSTPSGHDYARAYEKTTHVRWTENMDEKLIGYVGQGWGQIRISEALQISRRAIVKRMRELGLSTVSKQNLPPMTRAQALIYRKIRDAGIAREDALREALKEAGKP